MVFKMVGMLKLSSKTVVEYGDLMAFKMVAIINFLKKFLTVDRLGSSILLSCQIAW